jgi:hypothetical protein
MASAAPSVDPWDTPAPVSTFNTSTGCHAAYIGFLQSSGNTNPTRARTTPVKDDWDDDDSADEEDSKKIWEDACVPRLGSLLPYNLTLS